MNNDELKNKIVEILFPVLKGKRVSCNEENACERCWFPCEVDRLADSLADALITAGIGDVKTEARKVFVYSKEIAHLDKKLKEAEHRSQVAERALKLACKTIAPSYVDTAKLYFAMFVNQAEKELGEKVEDD